MPEPISNCRTIDAVTIGPIPNEIKEPNEAPKIIERKSKFFNALSPKPCNGTTPRIKYETNIINVQVIFVLNGRYFWEGPLTSGRLFIIEFIKDILPLYYFSINFFNFIFC